jgi:hypothetical protein
METVTTVVGICAGVATIGAMIVALWQAKIAKDARDDARQAQADAEAAAAESVTLAKKANEAFERQAAAQEEANAIARASRPPDGVRWSYEQVAGIRYRLVNVGTRVARGAVLEDIGKLKGFVRPEEAGPVDVRPDDSIEFTVRTAMGSPRPEFRVSWREDGSDEIFTDDTRMTIR